MERSLDMLVAPPRQRVSRMTALTLTDTWQTISFIEGSSAFNLNSFPQSRWDYTTNKLKINPDNTLEQSYLLSFDYSLTNVINQSKVQMRFVIPAPTPIYFPFPDDTEPYLDLCQLFMPGTLKQNFIYPIYGNTSMRNYGVQIQMRVVSYVPTANILSGVISLLTTVLSGTNRVILNNCSLNIYSQS